ncbi:MAG: lasso peptide biosynthesis B2 protein [Vicinamibacterales bacterium]
MTTIPLRRRVSTAFGIGRLLPMYAAFGALRYVVPLPTLARWAWRSPSGGRDLAREQRIVARVAWVQARTARLRPRGDCLHRSLLLYRELSRSGADPILVVGFRQAHGRMEGHAWVLADGGPVAESPAAVEAFTPALAFGRKGVLRASAAGAVPASSDRDDAVLFI